MTSIDDANLEKFGRHVPRILGNQIITQLVDQYLSQQDAPSIDPEFENTCPPSIERFHAALLFVDISGFTVLSQRLPVDALRLHINAYFKKILDIIFKYGGDVVKFAGDALFIIWQTPVSSLAAPNLEEAARISVQRAVSCGLEINVQCSNYMINLAPKTNKSQLTSALFEGKLQLQQQQNGTSATSRTSISSNVMTAEGTSPNAHGTASPTISYPNSPPNELADSNTDVGAAVACGTGTVSPATSVLNNNPGGGTESSGTPVTPAAPANMETATITYLNVHSGVGVGVMAGIDVGAHNRWEYLLLGQPLTDVAIAESMANKGELVISPAAHALLCGPQAGVRFTPVSVQAASCQSTSNPTIPESEAQNSPHSVPNAPKGCNCIRCAENEGFMRVDPNIPLVDAVNTETPEELAEYDLYFYSEIMERTTVAYREIVHQIDEICYNKGRSLHSVTSTGSSLSSLPTFSIASPRIERGMPNLAQGGPNTPNSGPNSASSTVQSSVRTVPSARTVPSERMAPHGMIAASGSVDFSHMPGEAESLDFTLSASGDARDAKDAKDGPSLPTVGEVSETPPAGLQRGLSSADAFDLMNAGNHTTLITKCSAEVTETLFGHYLSWIQQCLMDDFAMHVHEADRTDFEFKLSSRKGALEKFALQQYVTSSVQMLTTSLSTSLSTSSSTTNIACSNTPVKQRAGHRGSMSASMASSRDFSSRDPSNFVAKMRTLNTSRLTLKEQNKNKNRRIRNQDTSLTAELRNVIVLFISVKLESAQLFTSADDGSVSPSRKTVSHDSGHGSAKSSTKGLSPSQKSFKAYNNCYDRDGTMVHGKIKGFHFLSRTEEEFNDDQRIMNSFQDCMEVMTKIFKEHGGQMRQFIVDDKGTVCIGTFGLRGSVTNDNAAAAIDAAGAIIMQLHKIGIHCSIGITSGKAYCGLVGSPLRHEYAVMGPSTNLSARLMGKAKQGEVMCDGETRTRDRTHTFVKLGEIQAKGYTNLVPTFKPNISKRNQVRLGSSNLNMNTMNRMETLSGKSTTFFDAGNSFANMTSPSSHRLHHMGTLEGLSTSSGSQSNLQTPMGSRNRANRFKRKSTHVNADPNQQLPLEGRNEEIDDVFQFLCPGFVASYGPVTAFAKAKGGSGTSPTPSPSNGSNMKIRFDITGRTKATIVQGPSGIGKSSFVKIFCEKIRSIFKADKTANLFVFHNQSNSNNSQPFYVWKGIIRQVLLQFAQLSDPPASKSTHLISKLSASDLTSGKQDLIKGLDYATQLMAPDLHDVKPLMSSIHFVYGIKENDTTSKLSGIYKLLKITEFLSAILQQFTTSTGKLLVIAIDDLQTMDSASWQLLKHIWEHNTGIAILASHAANVTTKKGVDLNLFRDLDRIYLLDLKPLGLSATKAIASAIFETNNIHDVGDAVFEKLYTLSGGNALFLYELAKAMLEWYHNMIEEAILVADAAGEDPAAAAAARANFKFSDVIQDFRTTRIEEVICYRFDQFDTAAQLLLKLASVACANGGVFSLRLLKHMIQDEGANGGVFSSLYSASLDEYDEECHSSKSPNGDTMGFEAESHDSGGGSMLVATLNGLLINNEFIKIVKKRQESTTGSIRTIHSLHMASGSAQSLFDDADEADEQEDVVGELTLSPSRTPLRNHQPLTVAPVAYEYNPHHDPALTLGKLNFDFKIRLEQSTIYDLMLDEQKQALHERVASFLELEATQRNNLALTSTELYEEGFHWERATGWSSAMSCYYRSAMLLDEVGAFEDALMPLTAAYRMLNAMRNDAGVTEDFQFAPASFQAIFSHGKVTEEKSNMQALKKSDIVRIFGGDSALLELGLNVLLRLAQSSFTLSDSPEVTSKLYEDALQLIMLTWNWKDALALNQDLGDKLGLAAGTLDDGPISPQPGHMVSPAKLTRGKTHTSEISEVSSFGLQDPSIVFPILAGIAALYRNQQLQDDKQRTKESTLYDLSLVLARTSPDYLPHLICAMCLQRTLLFELGKVKESVTMTDGIVSMYNEKVHGPQLIKAYGNNRVPYTIMMHVQLLRILGYLNKSINMMNEVLESLPLMTHLHSVGITVYPILSVFLLEGSQMHALQVFKNYLTLEKDRGGFNFFKEVNSLFLEALETAVTHEMFIEKKDLSYFITHCETASSQSIEAKILNKDYLPTDKTKRSRLYDTLTSFGTPVEHCCGFLLLLKARMTSKRIEMRPHERSALVMKYLTTALEYENFHISCCVDSEQSASTSTSQSRLPSGPETEQNIDRFAFAHFGSLVTKACVLAMMVHLDHESPSGASSTLPTPTSTSGAHVHSHPGAAHAGNATPINKQELLAEATKCLLACEKIGVSKGYHFITLHAGVYLEVLGLDMKRGKQLQAQALDAMQELNGPKEFAFVFDAVISAFPILERFKIKYTLLDNDKTSK